MNLPDQCTAAADTREHKGKPCFLRNARLFYHDDCDFADANYFELRPVFDGGEFIWTSYLYGTGANKIQIRMGLPNQPAKLIATYDIDQVRFACEDFFGLSELAVPLWYDGNDVSACVTDRLDLVSQIAFERFSTSDVEFADLLVNTGLSKAEQAILRNKMEE